MTDESQISRFYAGKKVLVTGGTGFMGKVLIWKLLKGCPRLDVIYVLIRTKHGKNLELRKEEFFSSPIFDNFKKDDPEVLDKVVLLSGDVGEEGIALSDEDRDIIFEEVTIVFHSAAILKMNSDLPTAININTEGTLRMLELAQRMQKLEAFVYISTAYCCCDNLIVEEKIYPSKHNPYDVIKLVHWMEPEVLQKITPDLIHPLPNTYVYSKRLTESLLPDYTSKVPLIVARPTIVLPAYNEPIPGWNDQLFGPTGLFVAGGKGVLRTTMMNGDAKSNVIFVDNAIDAIIILPWANPKENLLKEVSVYNISQTAFEGLTWRDVLKASIKALGKYPFEIVLWYPPEEGFTNNVLVYNFKMIFFQYVPAYVIDFIMVLIGRKPFLVRVNDRLRHGESVLRYFTKENWKFVNDKIFKIEKQLNDADRRLFTVTMKGYNDVQSYFDNTVAVTRRYIFHEDDKTIPASKIRLNIMYFIDKVFLVLRYYLFWKLLMFMLDLFMRVTELYQY